MGTDIHGVFQKRAGDLWVDVPSGYNRERHYDLFAHLADVRNGSGFAGIVTGARVEPIAEPRGLPSDFELIDDNQHPISDEIASEWEKKSDWWEVGQTQPLRWIGDHSHSWLTAEEILSHDFERKTWKTGVVAVELFREWDGVSSPKFYSGGVYGTNVRVADNPCLVAEDTTHVRVCWREGGDRFAYFTDEVRKLADEHGEVRFVFGFDS